MTNDELQKELSEIRKLHQEYQNTITGRKQIIKEIRIKIDFIKSKTTVFNSELKELEDYYEYRGSYINDNELVMDLILRLANNYEDNYDMREVYVVDFINDGTITKKITGKALVIATNETLTDYVDLKEYYYDELSALSTRLINKGNSMVMVTDNAFVGNVKPRYKDLKKINLIDIKISSILSNISCFLHGDALEKAVLKIARYISINGPDFSGIDEEDLFNTIVNFENNEKKLVK